MPSITIPHKFRLNKAHDLYALEYLGTLKRFAVLVWHRRAKKSRSALNKQIMRIMQRKEPGVCYYALPTYRQAKSVMWDMLVSEHIPPEVILKKNESELAVYYKNGVIQRFIGTEDIDKHRGTNPFDVVFDEYAEMNEQIWTAIFQPVLRENGGTATFVFTPKGKNHAWKLVQMAKDNPEWFVSVKSVKDTSVFKQEELDEIQKNTPQALYGQEYLCEFLEGASQFFRRIHQCKYSADVILPEEGDFQLGVDLAKYNDWTVLTPFNTNLFIAYPQDRFNQVDYNLQEARIEAIARRYGDALIWPDATGVGVPIVENLKAKGLRVGNDGEGFRFTEVSRMNLLSNLAILLEQNKIRIPDDEGLLQELESFQYTMSEGGKVKVMAPEGMHDDRVMSLALSVWGMREPVRQDPYQASRIYQNRQRNASFT